jgi:hypothetical protein
MLCHLLVLFFKRQRKACVHFFYFKWYVLLLYLTYHPFKVCGSVHLQSLE